MILYVQLSRPGGNSIKISISHFSEIPSIYSSRIKHKTPHPEIKKKTASIQRVKLTSVWITEAKFKRKIWNVFWLFYQSHKFRSLKRWLGSQENLWMLKFSSLGAIEMSHEQSEVLITNIHPAVYILQSQS